MSLIHRLTSRLRADAHWTQRFHELEQAIRGAEDASRADSEKLRLLLGGLHSHRVRTLDPESLSEVEFSVFSQFGDDGIIQWLVHKVQPRSSTFVEFGVEDYREANTRFLLMNDNWSGLVLDGSESNVRAIQADAVSWRHDLTSVQTFVTAGNINDVLAEHGMRGEIGLLHIDLDGMDYWVWKAVEVVSPEIVVLEYNSLFGRDRAITVPYDPSFVRTRAHYSNLYQGASLAALCDLSAAKGYDFIGSNSAGNNAYFLRGDVNPGVRVLTAAEGFVESRFCESRDEAGELTHVRGAARVDLIRGLPVVDTRTGEIEQF